MTGTTTTTITTITTTIINRIAIGDSLRRTAARQPHTVALVEAGQETSYATLDRRCNQFANYLLSLGLQRGDAVVTLCLNSAFPPASISLVHTLPAFMSHSAGYSLYSGIAMKALIPLCHVVLLSTLLLTACGGGGLDSGAASSTATKNTTVNATSATSDTVTAKAVVGLTSRQRLGQLIFNDTNLSEPPGTACVSCHRPNMGFAGNNRSLVGVPLGSRGVLGLRNAMTNAYSGFVPGFAFRVQHGVTEAVGGHFWDGRVDTLALQALEPFLNVNEMNNTSAKAVMAKIAVAGYAPLFQQEFGADIFANIATSDTAIETAFTQVGVAMDAFERSDQLQSFSSKYDAMVRGQTQLAPAEQRGMALFMDAKRANCAGCHQMNPSSGNPQDSLFSKHTYFATGIPRNKAIPANADAKFYDLGLCGPLRIQSTLPATLTATSTVSIEEFCGKVRMPTLRNVAERPAYMHNGFFNDLREVVRFYSTRNSNPERWYGPSGVPNDLPAAYLGNIEHTKAPFNRSRVDGPVLTEAEVGDVVSFLGTLSDGFVLSATGVPAVTPPAPVRPAPPGPPPGPPPPRP